MLFSLDRFENDVAVLIDESECRRDVSRDAIPLDAKAGDMLREENGVYVKDARATDIRREQILRLQNKLRRK